MIDVEGLRAAITNAIDALAEVADQLPRPEPEEQFIAMAPADDRLPMVRTSVDVPLALHRQIKAECANNGEEISNAMRELIEICWPREKGAAGDRLGSPPRRHRLRDRRPERRPRTDRRSHHPIPTMMTMMTMMSEWRSAIITSTFRYQRPTQEAKGRSRSRCRRSSRRGSSRQAPTCPT